MKDEHWRKSVTTIVIKYRLQSAATDGTVSDEQLEEAVFRKKEEVAAKRRIENAAIDNMVEILRQAELGINN